MSHPHWNTDDLTTLLKHLEGVRHELVTEDGEEKIRVFAAGGEELLIEHPDTPDDHYAYELTHYRPVEPYGTIEPLMKVNDEGLLANAIRQILAEDGVL